MADRTKLRALLGGPDAVVTAGNPSWRDQIADWVGSFAGDNRSRADYLRETAGDVVDFVPGLGDAVGANDVYRDAEAGNYGQAALGASLAAVGAIPGVGDAAAGAVRKTMRHGVSKVKLRRALEDMTAQYADSQQMLPEVFKKPDEMFKIGDTIIPLPGDRTIAGKQLMGVNEMEFEKPVDLIGGGGFKRSEFQTGPDRSAWASQRTAASRQASDVRRAAKGGGDVYGAFMPMAGVSSDFSDMSASAVQRAIQASKSNIAKSDIERFDELLRQPMKGIAPATPDFPGVLKMDDAYLHAAGGNFRKKLIKSLDSDDIMKRGFPDAGSIRKALTEPDLLNANNLDQGWAFSKMDPEGRLITEPKKIHPAYDTQVGGTYAGRTRHLAPLEVSSPDWYNAREKIKPGENASQREYDYKLKLPAQRVDQQWIDTNSLFQEAAEQGEVEEFLRKLRASRQ